MRPSLISILISTSSTLLRLTSIQLSDHKNMTVNVQHEAETQMTKKTAINDAVDQTVSTLLPKDSNHLIPKQWEQEFRRWLSPPDPSTNHHITLTTHHKSTTAWFLEGNVFSKWKSTPSFLWVNGKRIFLLTLHHYHTSSERPLFCSGLRENYSLVGGSRLPPPMSTESSTSSSIIEHVKAFRNSGLAYFYFDFRDENKQSRDNLLRSLLFQLSTQYHHLSDILSHLHSLYEDGNQQPSDDTLARCLKKMLSHPNQDPVYLIIDGVDECPNSPECGMPSPREQVLKLIEELAGFHLPNLHLCVTSRPEVGIHMTLKDLITFSVSLHEQGGHKEDIMDFINSVVYSDPKMGSWSEKDKKLVVETLSKNTDGV
jgi:NACHT domain